MFPINKNTTSLLLKIKNIYKKTEKKFFSLNTKIRVKSPSLTTFKSQYNSMISILARIFSVLTIISFTILLVLSPLYEIYTWNTIWHTFTWPYKEIFCMFSLTGHLITHYLHKRISKKN